MAKGKLGIVGAFTLRFGLGMTSSKWWPVIKEKAEPLGRELLSKGMDAAINGKPAAIIGIADTLKETSKLAIKKLSDMGIQLVMATGDNKVTANAIAQQFGIQHVLAESSPEAKVDEVARFQ